MLNIQEELVIFENSSTGVKVLTVIGALYLISIVADFFGFVFKHVRPAQNLTKRYGSNAWAIVTGPTEGIGKSFCFSLASRGFNVALVARNKAKAEKVVAELQKRYAERRFRIVIADFSKSLSKESRLCDHIYSEIAELDIAILVNNVGLSFNRSSEYFHDTPLSEIIELIIVNTAPQSQLTHALLPKLIERSKTSRAAVINLSSFAGTVPIPFMEDYSATKAFNDHLSTSLDLEYDRIDFLSLRPMMVESNLTATAQKVGMSGIITAEECTETTLNQLGYTSTTYGHFKHAIQASLFHQFLPKDILTRMTGFSMRILAKKISDALKKQE